MEQEIQYCTSADGIRIAFSIVGGGSGVPLVYLQQPPFASVTEPWQSLSLTEKEISPLWRESGLFRQPTRLRTVRPRRD